MHAIKIFTTCLAALLTVGADKPPASQPATLPSQKAIVESFEAGGYPATLQQLSRVIPLKGKAAAEYDRHELLMLKGESHLQLKQLKAASEAFAAAAKETDEEPKASAARAMQQLLKQSKNMKLTRRFPRKGEKLQSADLLDLAQRKDAFRIAYEDLSTESDPKIKAAMKSRSLVEITETMDVLAVVGDLEMAATGGDARCKSARTGIAERVRGLIEKEFSRAEKNVLEIRERANAVMTERLTYQSSAVDGEYTGGASRRVILRGLSAKDRGALQESISTCTTIVKTAKSFEKKGDLDAGLVDDFTDRAKETIGLAEKVLNAKY